MLQRLHAAVSAVAPIVGVSGVQGDIRIDFSPSATGPQQTAAQGVVAAFDWSQAAQDAWEQQQAIKEIGAFFVVRKGADQATGNVAFQDCTGLSFDLAPNAHYEYEFTGAYTAAAGTTGLQISVNGPASPDFIRFVGWIATSTTASFNGAGGAYDAAIAATASGGSTALPFWLSGTISTGAAGGPFMLRFRSEINGSAVTVLRGSKARLAAVA